MNRIVFLFLFMAVLIGCKTKKKDKPDVPAANFLVNDYIKGQVAMLDTARYLFKKIETTEDRSDTVLVKNSAVRFYAQDFLNLPDLASEGLKDDYDVSHLYDELQQAFIFTYTTKEDHPVRVQHVTVEPEMDSSGKSNIRSVYVDFWDARGDSTIRKNMMWRTDHFYVTTTTESPGRPQKIKTIKIVWNGFEEQSQQKEP